MSTRSEPRRRLPVGRILLASYAVVWARRRPVLRSLWLPTLLLALAGLALDTGWPAGTRLARSVIWLAALLALAAQLRATLRIVLVGPQAVAGVGIVPWTREHTRFFGWLLGVNVLSVLIMIVGLMLFLFAGGSAPEPLVLRPLALAVLYVAVRLSLVLPPCALDRDCSLEAAWALGRGHGLGLLLLLGVSMVLLPGLPSLVLADSGPAGLLLANLLGFCLFVPGGAALALAYHALAGDAGLAPPGEQGQQEDE